MTSTSATTPIDSSASESVSRPSRDGSRGGLTGGGGGGGGTPSPGYGYGLLAYGPYGANGARYPVLPLVGSAAGGGAAVKDMVGGTSLGGTGGGGVGYGGGVGGVGYGGGTGGRDREPFRFARMIAATTRPPMTTQAWFWPNRNEPMLSAVMIPTITTMIGLVRDRPRPTSASSGEPVSPSDGMSSQPAR